MKAKLWIAVGFLVASTAAAAAQQPPFPAVSFTGEGKSCLVIDGKEDCSTVTMVYTPERFRFDLNDPSGRQISYYDVAKKTATSVDFGEKTYWIGPLDPKSDDLSVLFLAGPADYARVGDEPVGGAPTVKYKLSAKRDKLSSDGFIWIGADNIVRRVQVTTTGLPNNASVTLRFDAAKVTVGAVDPKSLEVEIPSGFKKVER